MVAILAMRLYLSLTIPTVVLISLPNTSPHLPRRILRILVLLALCVCVLSFVLGYGFFNGSVQQV